MISIYFTNEFNLLDNTLLILSVIQLVAAVIGLAFKGYLCNLGNTYILGVYFTNKSKDEGLLIFKYLISDLSYQILLLYTILS